MGCLLLLDVGRRSKCREQNERKDKNERKGNNGRSEAEFIQEEVGRNGNSEAGSHRIAQVLEGNDKFRVEETIGRI